MRNLVLKMVQEDVVNAENANKILKMKVNVDPIWFALAKGMIDEKKLANFYEHEGFPVIYDEKKGMLSDDFFSRFFTPDVMSRLLAIPLSFKKETKEIVIGFINSALINQIKETILKIFPGFTINFVHIPASVFKKIAAKHFLFDIDRFTSVLSQLEPNNELFSDKAVKISTTKKKLKEVSEQIFTLELENAESVIFKEETMTSRFPLKSLTTFKDIFNRNYTEFVPETIINSLSHTEKILLFTNIGIKKSDKVALVASDDSRKVFFLMINPHVDKEQIEFIIR
ncbi:hypothetical protein J6Z19_07020 [bacterium]|nr:hypothetical protein [bacterium]